MQLSCVPGPGEPWMLQPIANQCVLGSKEERRRLSADLLEPILEESDRLHLVWVKSHLTEEQFRVKFPALPKWRHAAYQNGGCPSSGKDGKPPTARSHTVPYGGTRWLQRSTSSRDRMVAMLNYNKDQRPQVEFQDKSQRAPGRRARTGVKSNPVFQKAKEPKPNKRRILEALLRGEQNKEHSWMQGSAGATNITIQYSECGLFINKLMSPGSLRFNQGYFGLL